MTRQLVFGNLFQVFFVVGGFPLSVYLDAYFRIRCSRFHVHSGDVRIRIVCVYCRALLDV